MKDVLLVTLAILSLANAAEAQAPPNATPDPTAAVSSTE